MVAVLHRRNLDIP